MLTAPLMLMEPRCKVMVVRCLQVCEGCVDESTIQLTVASECDISALGSHSFILFIHYLHFLRSSYSSLITHSHLRSHALLSRGHGWHCNAHRKVKEAEMIIPFSKSTVEPSLYNYRLQCTLWVGCDYSITLCVSVCVCMGQNPLHLYHPKHSIVTQLCRWTLE